MPPNKISYKWQDLIAFLLHEFFHIFFRLNKELQKPLYEMIGFKLINEIELPEDLMMRKLTNPDGPILNNCVIISDNNQSRCAVSIIILKDDIRSINDSKDIIDSICTKLLVIEYKGSEWKVLLEKGIPILLELSSINGIENLKQDSIELLDPNEILAEAFVQLALNKPGEALYLDEF